MASDWLRHFWPLLWYCWTEFKETWLEARSQCPLPSLCFSGRWGKQDIRPGLWLAETFSTFPLKPPNGIQQNLTGSKISMSSTKFVFSGQLEKQDCRPTTDWLRHFGLLIWSRLRELNVTLQEARSQRPLTSLSFSCRWVYKMAALADLSKRWNIVLRCTICGPFGPLVSLFFPTNPANEANPYVFEQWLVYGLALFAVK